MANEGSPGAETDTTDAQGEYEVSTHQFEIADSLDPNIKAQNQIPGSSKAYNSIVKPPASSNDAKDIPLVGNYDAVTKPQRQSGGLLEAATKKNKSNSGVDINMMLSQATKPSKNQIGYVAPPI